MTSREPITAERLLALGFENRGAGWIHYGLPADIYHGLRAASSTALRRILTASPAHAVAERQDTDAMRLGTALHMATLEPAEFARRYHVEPYFERRSNEAKQRYAALQAACEASGLTLLWDRDCDHVEAMRAAIFAHPKCGPVLAAARREVSVVWQQQMHGGPVWAKCRFDALVEIDECAPIVADVKTTSESSADGFARAIFADGYDVQAAHYLRGAAAVNLTGAEHYLISVEKQAPHGVQLWEVDPDDLAGADADAQHALRVWRDCDAAGKWPGYPATIRRATAPAWLRSRRMRYYGE